MESLVIRGVGADEHSAGMVDITGRGIPGPIIDVVTTSLTDTTT